MNSAGSCSSAGFRHRSLFSALLLGAFVLAAAHPRSAGQGPSVLRLSAVIDGSAVTLGPGATIPINAPSIGETGSVRATLRHASSSPVAISLINISGDAGFSVANLPPLPTTITSTQALEFDVRYQAFGTGVAAGQLLVVYQTGSAPAATFVVNLSGAIAFEGPPELRLAYSLPVNNNVLPLADGGTLPFIPPVSVDTSLIASLFVVNEGLGPGRVTSAAVSGDGFELVNLPLLPRTLPPDSVLEFGIRFSPEAAGTFSGELRVEYEGGSFTIGLTADAIALSYELIQGEQINPISRGQVIVFPDTALEAESALILRVRNVAEIDGFISALSVSGGAFQPQDPAISLPLLVPPKGYIDIPLLFRPVREGQASGQLRVNNDVFLLSGLGLSSRPDLEYSYSIEGLTSTVEPNGLVLLPAAAAGFESEAQFAIRNVGRIAANILRIDLAGTDPPFELRGVPALPLTLEPGSGVTFTVVFLPRADGLASVVLAINGETFFTISGSGSAPPPLPSFHIEGPSGTVGPLEQPAIGFRLDEPYPLPLLGLLTLRVNSQVFSDDPGIQFATGGRNVNFRIPAGATQAVFPGGASSVRLQTGTIAGSITITPAIATEDGLLLTEDFPPELVLNVAPAAPRLTSVRIGGILQDGFVVLVTGYSTTRSLRQMTLRLTPEADVKLAADSFPLDAESSFRSWYATPESSNFGSQFTVQIPFRVQRGSSVGPLNVTEFIQSVAVTAANELGESNSLSTNLR
jgi:hypothetical protein